MADAQVSLRSEVAVACRVLAAQRQGDFIWGHVSARDPDGRGAWIKAAGHGLDEIDDALVHLVDRDGAVLEGEGRRHREYPIHTEILAARPDVGAVVHTHAPNARIQVTTRAASRYQPPRASNSVARIQVYGGG